MRLVLVTGAPGSGKTSLARALAPRLDLALLEKDTVKEALFDALGTGDRAWSRRLSDAAYAVIFAVAGGLDGAIVEGNLEAARVGARVSALSPEPIEVFCRCDPAVAAARFAGRARHPGHRDAELAPEVASLAAAARPLAIGRAVLTVETTEPPDPGEVAAWVRAQDAWHRSTG